MDLKGVDEIKACKVEIQVAIFPEKKYVVRTLTIENKNGNRVGFTIPPACWRIRTW